MRTIEVYSLKDDYQKLIARMSFLNDKDFQEMATRITTAAPCNSVRYDRACVCLIRLIYHSGSDMEYYTDHVTEKILTICDEYRQLYERAQELAQKRGWKFAWQYASPDWRHKATLRQMGRAKKNLL
jgi:hypothetical protein